MTPFHHWGMRIAAFLVLVFTAAGIIGCGGSNSAAKAELPPPQVTVAVPVAMPITRYEYATGRAEPLEQVEIRARVSGYLKTINFEPGQEVKKDQLLFEIDPDPFKADLAKAKANEEIATADKSSAEADLLRADARVVFTKGEFARQEDQFKKGGGSQKDFDKAKSDLDESTATVQSTKAKIKLAAGKINEAISEVDKAKLNLDFCTIKAPIDGLIGDRLVTVGNLVTGGVGSTTLLTTIVSVEKMDVGFDVDEGTIQRIQQAMRDKMIVMPAPGEILAEAGLAIHGTDYPLKGKLFFFDNKLDVKTGTQRLKARFDNPKPATGKRVLSAGMYARIRVPIGQPAVKMLVPEEALGSDQGDRFLYLVDSENKAIQAKVQAGISVDVPDASSRVVKMRVIDSVAPQGSPPRPLTDKDRVIVGGVMRVRPGIVVDPKQKK
jgi:RND family efflux transporter MFP subunit